MVALVRRTIVGLVAALAVFLWSAAMPLQAQEIAAIRNVLPEPTPLILKDGRIAFVTVYTIPFESGESELGGTALSRLNEILTPIATDCFLTAQAIGHVEPGANNDGDTLSAHRLARARADLVQRALIDRGLPQSAIASVWDWQFLVRSSRVTLWVFRLNEGEDCEGTPISAGGIAQAPLDGTGAPSVTADAETVDDGLEASGTGEVETERAATEPVRPSVPRELTTSEETARSAADPGEPAVAPGEDVLSGEARIEAEEIPPPSAEELADLAEEQAPALEEPSDEVATGAGSTQAALTGSGSGGAVASASITFGVNSSYFGAQSQQTLQRFVDELPAGESYTVELRTSVGSGDVQDATPAEARKYNRWMAERRALRVTEWLEQNAEGRSLELEPVYIEDDESRSVQLRALPAS